MSFDITALAVAIITAIIGPIIVYYSTRQKYNATPRSSYINADYGIKIISPRNRSHVSGTVIEVTGLYATLPPSETLRLFTIHPTKTSYGERVWPQEVVKEFYSETQTWRAHVHLGSGSGEELDIVAAVVGQSVIILWDFYYKVGPVVGWWEFEGWPDQAIICDRVTTIKAS